MNSGKDTWILFFICIAMFVFFCYTVSQDDYVSPYPKEVKKENINEGNYGKALMDPTGGYLSGTVLMHHLYSDD